MDYQMLINGEQVSGDKVIDVVNPATEQVVAQVPHATMAQLNVAVQAAKTAQQSWALTSMPERQAKVEALAAAIAAESEAFAKTITLEQGKPLAEAKAEVDWSCGYLAHTATLQLPDRVIQDDEHLRIETRHRPLGVVAGIIAWNFPLLLCCWKIGPALMAGNAIVLKPAPTTPLSALKLGELCARIFPPGLVNIITDANDLGPALTSHPDVAKIGFTGSSETGKKIAANAADTMKRVTLEMGGNDAAIVLADVDLDQVAKSVYGGAFVNAGQVCLAVKRAYVHDDIFDAMCDKLAALAEQATVGDGMDDGTTIGPIQNKEQFEKVKRYLDDARADGSVVSGGDVREGPGYFITPAIVRDARDGQKIVDEEQFGPILPVIRFSDVDDVVNRVNASEYGLGGAIHSADVDAATDIAGRIESGTVWVNQQLNIGPHIPMAGCKASGLGVEQSVEGLTEYTQMQVINVARR